MNITHVSVVTIYEVRVFAKKIVELDFLQPILCFSVVVKLIAVLKEDQICVGDFSVL